MQHKKASLAFLYVPDREGLTNFVIHMVFQHVGLSLIIDNNKHLNFEMAVIVIHWMEKCTKYNTTICKKFNGKIFKDSFKTGFNKRYELMCSVDVQEKRACINN